jgi:hypothetical protein
MKYFEEFLLHWENKNPGTSSAIRKSASELIEKLTSSFNYKSQMKGLLLGQVQSGKTSQMLAAVSSLADRGFKLFVLLTSDMTKLQEQTLKRAFRFLPREFNTCDETDGVRFKEMDLKTPTVVVLKKNSKVLKSWKRELSALERCKYEPAIFLDDEADAASLNTKVNQKEVSSINKLLDEIGKIPPSSIYIQVTATPQALLLQTLKSGWKPEMVHVFEPGAGYCGGAHFYGEDSKCIRTVSEHERVTLLESSEIPSGLQEALMSFLINSIYGLNFCKKEVCNFLIHPGAKIGHHNAVENKIQRLLRAVQTEAKTESELLRSTLFQAYEDIKNTCFGLPAFNYFWENLGSAVERTAVQILNSNTISEINYEKGSNILIGGNATGRGITFSGLQVVYYCRESKVPQADTLWQHSRIFGYDRDPQTCRIFLPPRLLQIFRRLNEANDSMFKMLVAHGLDQVTILEPEGVQPTRKNILDQEALIPIIGDSNSYFELVTHENTPALDAALGLQDKEEEIAIEKAIEALSMIGMDEDAEGEDLDLYIRCLKTLKSAGEKSCYLIVRTDRDIAKGTGSLLSPNDRAKGSAITDKTVLTLYRVNGQREKGWKGFPLWVPNLKFPKGRCFYSVA